MKLPLKITIEKKHKYLIQSAMVVLFIGLVSFGKIAPSLFSLVVISTVLVFVGTFLTHFPNIDLRNLFYSILMPASLLIGSLLFVIFFPNLGLPFKIVTIISFGVFYYLVCLVDNIFLCGSSPEIIFSI